MALWRAPARVTTLDEVTFYNRVMDTVHEIKLESSEAAKSYRMGFRDSALGLLTNRWRIRVTHRYEDFRINYEYSVQRMLLAALIAERYMLRKYRNLWKHVTISIVGLAGSGKTTYSILSAIGGLMLVGASWDKARELASRLIFFNPRDLVDFLLELTKAREWTPIIIIDDVGGQISKYWYMLGERYYSYLFSILDQVKDLTGVIVTTARSFQSIPARLREISDLVVDASEVGIDGILVDLFKWFKHDDYARTSRRKDKYVLMIDAMPPTARMPDDIWQAMVDARASTAHERLQIVKEALEIAPVAEKEKLEKLRAKLEALAEEMEEAGIPAGEEEAGRE